MVRTSILAVGLLAAAGCSRGADPKPASNPEEIPARTLSDSERVRFECLHGLSEHNDAVPKPAPFWREHRVYSLINYTMPHIPDCRVAVGPDQEILVLAGHGDRVVRGDPIESFNRIVSREQVEIDDDNRRDYLAFVLEGYIASFDAEKVLPSEEAARAVLDGKDPAPGAVPADPPFRIVEGSHEFTVYYWEYWWGVVVEFVVRIAEDGTIDVDERTYGQRES